MCENGGVARDRRREQKTETQQKKGKQMKDSMPNALPNGKGILSKAGAAPEPGGTRYLDMATGNHTTLFEALVITTGARFSMVAVKGNQVLNKVRVDHDAVFGGERVAVGDTLLAGAITMAEPGPLATRAWPFRVPEFRNGQQGAPQRPAFVPPPPRPVRHVGTVTRVHPSGKFAEVLEDGTGHRFFAHHTTFVNSAKMMTGFRVCFTPAKTERGLAALDIRPHN
jgi:hypothetical protein